jgi:acyl-CoA thioesterase FadM
MSRKSIPLPAAFIYRTDYVVLYTDVNAADHLGADRVLPIAMEAQLRFIKSLGYDNAITFEDAGLIMAHSEVQYMAEAMYGDKLEVLLAADHFADKSFQLIYSIRNHTRDNEMARVATTLLFFNYEQQRVTAVPYSFRTRLDSLPPLADA